MAPYETLAEWSGRAWPQLANHLWQATLFSALALAAAALLRRAPAGVRYYVWLTALIKFALPSALLVVVAASLGLDLQKLTRGQAAPAPAVLAVSPLLSPISAPQPDDARQTAPAADADAAPARAAATRTDGARAGVSVYALLTCVWLAGCFALLAQWYRQRRRLASALRGGRVLDGGREVEALRRVEGWLGRRRRIRLLVTGAVSEPGVWRVWRPVIVLPEGVADGMDDAELEALLLHEAAHVERRDNLAGNLQRLLCCLFWFHPLVWLIDRRLLTEREQACDDAVVRLSGASRTYASSIAKVCRHFVGRRVAGLSGAAGPDLKRRLERILSDRAGGRSSAAQLSVVVFLAAAALGLSLVAGHAPASEQSGRLFLASGAAAVQEDSTDERFVVGRPRSSYAQTPARQDAQGQTHAQASTGQGQAGQVSLGPLPPLEVYAEGETVESDAPPPSEGVVLVPLPQPPPQPPQDVQAGEPPAEIQAAIVNASDAEYGDLRRFVGRYEVDPERSENFVLDVTLEYGELWIKPSHTGRRRLIRRSETAFTDSSGHYKLEAVLDGRERVVGLKLSSWGPDVFARKLALPRPSLTGNTTFRLRGYENARVVAVAGTFNDWNQSQLIFAREGGEWVCRVDLPPGTYQYKFIVDGDWLTDPRNPKRVQDERGFTNSLLRAE